MAITIGDAAGWFGLSTELWAGIIGALVGSIVGGIISLGLQLQSFRQQRQNRAADLRGERLVVGYAILVKMIRIHSNFVNLLKHMNEAKAVGDAHDPPLEWWQCMLPIANLPDRASFDNGELVLVAGMRDDFLFAAMMNIDHIHNSNLDAFASYERTRVDLGELLPSTIVGTVGEVLLDREQMMRARPRMIEANSVAEALHIDLTQNAKESADLLDRLLADLQAKDILPKGIKLDAALPREQAPNDQH